LTESLKNEFCRFDFLSYRTFSNFNCLVTFGFGEQGKIIESMTEAQLIADVTPALQKMFGSAAKAPRRAFVTSWNSDPYAGGAYSFQAVNCTSQDHVTLATPASQSLLFAGEHTHELYRATVHGAFLSVEREADRVISQSGSVPAGSTLSINAALNLIGNGVEAPISVGAVFDDASKVLSVWKWVVSGSTQGVTYPA